MSVGMAVMVFGMVLFSATFVLFRIASNLYGTKICINGDQNNNYKLEMKQGKYDVMSQLPN